MVSRLKPFAPASRITIPSLQRHRGLPCSTSIRAAIERLKALLATSAALELEADARARHAQCKAELLRLAQQYEAENLPTVAQELRQHAEALDGKQPLAGALIALASWQSGRSCRLTGSSAAAGSTCLPPCKQPAKAALICGWNDCSIGRWSDRRAWPPSRAATESQR